MNQCVETLNLWSESFSAFAWPMLWQSSLLIAVIFAFDSLFARRIRASVRYALWIVVLVKLLLPPALALPTGATWWIWRPHPVVETPAIKNYTVSYGDSMPEALPPAIVPVVVPPPKLIGNAWALLAVAAVGTGLISWLAFRWLSVAAKVRRAATAPPELDAILEEARQLAGLRRHLRLRLVEDRQSPAVYGLFRPVILLPRTLASQLTGRQLRAVLLHESIHLRRGDVWVNFAQTLLQIAYWWHPLLWLANARIRRVREEAVDDAVMHALRDGADAYAPTLLEVAKFAFRRPLASLGLIGILESRSALRQRVERLVDFQPSRRAGITVLSLCGIFAFSAVALPMGQGPAADEPATPQGLNQTTPPVNSNDSPTNGTSGPAELALTRALALEHKNAHWYITLTSQTNAHGVPMLSVGGLDFIRLDEFGPFRHASLSLVIDKLSMKDPNNIGILVTSKLLFGSQTLIDMPKMTNSVLSDVLDAIVRGSNPPIKYSLVDRFIVFFPIPQTGNQSDDLFDPISGTKVFISPDTASNNRTESDSATGAGVKNIVYTSAMREPIYRELNRADLTVSYNDLPLSEVLRELRELSIKRDPEKQGINFLFNPNIAAAPTSRDPKTGLPVEASWVKDPTQINISLSLNNVSLQDVLNAICLMSDHPIKYSVEDYGIVFSAKGTNTPPYEMRTFKVVPNSFYNSWKSDFPYNGVVPQISESARAYFSKLGVNLNPPKALVYNDRVRTLFVYATPQDIDIVQKAVQALNEDPPPIFHVQAYQIDGETFLPPEKLSGTLTNYTGAVGMAEIQLEMRKLQDVYRQAGYTNVRVVLQRQPLTNGTVHLRAVIAGRIDETMRTPNDLSVAPPQFHIKARFIGVPKKFFSSAAANSLPPGMINGGILTAAESKKVLWLLESQKGVVELAQPEVTTLSGRQTIMKVSTFQPVFTNSLPIPYLAPHISVLDTGSIFDVSPVALSDGHTLHLSVTAYQNVCFGYVAIKETPVPAIQVNRASANVDIYDGQTVVLFPALEQESVRVVKDDKSQERVTQFIRKARKKQGDKVVVVLATATLIDAVGNRIHSNSDYYDHPDFLNPVPGTRTQLP